MVKALACDSRGRQKLQTTRYFTHMPDAPNQAIVLNFGVSAGIADLITHAKFCVNQFRGFRAVTPPRSGYLHVIGWWLL